MTIMSRAISLPEVAGRTLEGIAYKYSHPANVSDDDGRSRYWEEILHGADLKGITDRGTAFPLLVWHSRTSNKGRMPAASIGEVEFRPTVDHLAYKAVMSRSALADEMLELVGDETARDVSVSFRALNAVEGLHAGERLVSRSMIKLRELSLCPTGTGQHADAKVLVMRATDARPMSDFDVRLRLLNL